MASSKSVCIDPVFAPPQFNDCVSKNEHSVPEILGTDQVLYTIHGRQSVMLAGTLHSGTAKRKKLAPVQLYSIILENNPKIFIKKFTLLILQTASDILQVRQLILQVTIFYDNQQL